MTTTVISTIKSSLGDYTSLATWEAGEQGDLVTADEIRVAECYDDWPSGLSGQVIVDGSVTSATQYLKIIAAAGSKCTGTVASGFYVVHNADWNNALTIGDPYTRVEHIGVQNTSTNGSGVSITSAANCTLRGVVCYSKYIGIQISSGSSNAALINCCSFGNTYGGFSCDQWGTGQVLYNCVSANNGQGFDSKAAGSAKIFKNCVAYSNTTNFTGANFSASCSNNAASNATTTAPPGTSPLLTDIVSGDFTDAAGKDFHLASGSSLIGAGVNLTGIFTLDIDEDTWPATGAWDIGYDYRIGAGGVNLASDATTTAASTAALSVSIPLAGAAISTATTTGGLSLSLPLAGTATATANATGGLSLSVPLSAAAVANAAATGAVALNITLSGAAIAEAVATAGLDVQSTGTVSLSGSAAAESSATGALSLAIPLSGASLVVSSADGSLSQIVPLAGAAASVSLATGGLDVSAALSELDGAALSEASADATLTLRVNLDGAALVNAIAAGALAGTGVLTGTAGYTITGSSRNWRIAS